MTKTLSLESRKQQPSCPEDKCDQLDQGSPFRSLYTNSASSRLMSNPLHQLVFLPQHLMSGARARVQVEPQRHQPTSCRGVYCSTSTDSPTLSLSQLKAEASLSITNPAHYLVVLAQFLASSARASLTKTMLDTIGQDEGVMVNDIAYGWRNRYQSIQPSIQPSNATEFAESATEATISSGLKLELKRHEHKQNAIRTLKGWQVGENCSMLCVCGDKCPLDALLQFPTPISAASRSHSLPLKIVLDLLFRWPSLLFSGLHAHAIFAQAEPDILPTPSTTPLPSLHLAVARKPQDAGSIPAQIAEFPQSRNEISLAGIAVQMKCCWSPEAASALANGVAVCSSASSNRWSAPARRLRQPMDSMNLRRTGVNWGITRRKPANISQSTVEVPTVAQVRFHRNLDGSLALNLDLNLTDAAYAKNATSEDGKNARESLGFWKCFW